MDHIKGTPLAGVSSQRYPWGTSVSFPTIEAYMRKRLIPVLLFAIGACSNDPPTDPGILATTVHVTYPASFVIVGETVQLSASVLDASGNPVPAATLEWSSSQTAVATVNSSGAVLGRSQGSASITARYGTASASVLIQVDAEACTSELSLSVGEVRQIRGASALGCITLAPSTNAEEYLFVVGNAKAEQDAVFSYTATLTGTAAVQGRVAPSPWLRADDRVQVREMTHPQRVEARLRAYERAATRDALPNTQRRRSVEVTGAALSVHAAQRDVGDTLTIRVPNLAPGKDICRDFITTRAVVRAISDRAIMLEDVASPPGKMTIQDYQGLAEEFDDIIFPTDTLWFGSPTDLNSDQRVSIVYTPEVNKLTPAGSTGIVGGFFFGGDIIRRSEYPETAPCRNQTNEQEIFYILAPDPQGTINGNARTTAGVRQVTRGTIAHEFQHMINQSVRQYNPQVKSLEVAWLNEAMSHFAEEAVGRAIRGFSDFESLNAFDINPDTNNQGDYLAYFRQNQTRFLRWNVRPDTSSPTSQKAENQLASRGAAWALVRYAADHYSNNNAKAFFRSLAVGPETDITNLILRSGNRPFDEIIGGWLVANYADNRGIPNLATKYSYVSWDMPGILRAANGDTLALKIDEFPGNYSSQAHSGSGNFYHYDRPAQSGAVTLQLKSVQGVSLSTPDARVWILRVN